MIQELDSINSKLINLDPCKKVEPGSDLESVKSTIDTAILDLDLLAVEGLANRSRSTFEQSQKIKMSLEKAQSSLIENMYNGLSGDEQMRILSSPTNSPGGPQMFYIRLDSHSSVVSVTSITNMETESQDNLECEQGPSSSQKRHKPEPEKNAVDNTKSQKKTKT